MQALDQEICELMVQDKEISIWEIDQRLDKLAANPYGESNSLFDTLTEVEELES